MGERDIVHGAEVYSAWGRGMSSTRTTIFLRVVKRLIIGLLQSHPVKYKGGGGGRLL